MSCLLGSVFTRVKVEREEDFRSLSENSVVGPRASVFLPDKDDEAGDIGFIIDTAG
jgi:hypothetical protein